MTFVEKCIIFCILTLFVFLLTGCITCEPKVELPVGYSLIMDYEGNIRVVLPNGRVTNGKWVTTKIAIEYARYFEEWSTSYTE